MTGIGSAQIAPPPLRLRGDPPRVMRLSRKTLIGVACVTSAVIGGALLYALRPSTQPAATELYETDAHAATERLADAPKDYSHVPKLGPPLPGDLGRPILSAQKRERDAAYAPSDRADARTPRGPAADAAQAARQRLRQERDAARTSKVFSGGDTMAATATAPVSRPPAESPAPPPTEPVAPAQGATTDQAAKRGFLRQGQATPRESDARLAAPSSPYIVQAGSVLPAALITGIRSDLPGQIAAQVTRNVYDSVTGRYLLIPQGSRLLGEYDSQVSVGQNRVLLVWNRLILPDGRSVDLDRLPGTDRSGYAGLQDRTDQHWGGILRAAFISTLLSVGTQAGSGSDDDLVRALRQGSADSIARTGQDFVRRQMGVQPTLTIGPGFQLRVLVTRDLVLGPSTGDAK